MHCLPTSSVETIVAAALPTCRLTADFCFQTTGTDFALFVKSIYAEQLNVFKCYICLFTFATSRDVHLELTPSLQGGAFIRTLKRFITRRGYPRLLICDSTKTFTCNVVKSYLLRNDIDINFILPVSPWWGGFYERLARSVKMPLKKVKESYRKSKINVRGDGECSRGSSCKLSTINPYLSELREYHIHQSKRKTSANNENILKLGDVVITKDDKVRPRDSWRTGLVKSFVVGKDGKIRGALLTTQSDEGKRTQISRPVQKLIPFEVGSSSNNDEIISCNEKTDITSDISVVNSDNTSNHDVTSSNEHGESIHDKDENDFARNIFSSETSSYPRPRRNAALTGEAIRRVMSHK